MKKILYAALWLSIFIFWWSQFLTQAAQWTPNGNFWVNHKCYWEFDDQTNTFTVSAPSGDCTLETDSKNVWEQGSSQIKIFKINSWVKAPSDMSNYFSSLTHVESLNVNELDVSNVEKMEDTFENIAKDTKPINELDISKWKTSKVTSMQYMFGLSNIKFLKLGSGFDTSKVSSFYSMFIHSKFEELILDFDTSKVSDFNMMYMFCGAIHLKKLDISSFEMSKARSWEGMFENVGSSVKEGTEIIVNSSFERQSDFSGYNLPNGFYAVNGGEAKATNTALNAEIGKASGRATLIPVMPLHISINGGDGVNVGEDIVHRVGTEIDMSGVVAIKNGHKLVKWTNTDDGQNARIEIPAYGKSTNTWADYYNSASGSQLTIRQSLYAQWAPMSASDKCKVLVLNVDDSSLLTKIEVTCGNTIAESDIKIPGHTPVGVYDGNLDPFDFSTQIMNDTIIYAKISAILYNTMVATATKDTSQGAVGLNPNNITYDSEGPGHLPYGTSVTYYAKPADGYKFVKWDIKEDYYSDIVAETSTNNPVTFKIEREIYYIAVFAPDTAPVHKVTFELDGGTINGASTYSVDVEDGKTVIRLTDPVKTGHRFVRWCEDAALTTEFDFSKKISGPTTIYAEFVEQVTTTLDANGGKTDSNWKDSGNTDKGSTIYQVGDFFSSHLSLFGVSAPDNKEYDGVEITDANGTYTFKENDGKSYTTNLDFSVKFLWKDTSVNPITTYTISVVSGTANPSSAQQGAAITITADQAASGYAFDKWQVEEGVVSLNNANDSTTTFTMPDSNVRIKATYKSSTPSSQISTGVFWSGDTCQWTLFDDGSFVIEPANSNVICELENKGDNNEWYIRKDNIKSLVIKPGVEAPVVMDRFFEELRNIKTIDVNNLDVSNTTRMFGVFIHLSQNTNGINELDLSNWNTSNVEVMASMFGTSNIKKLKIGSYFNTSKVRSFYDMFSSSKFEELTLPFDTSSANDINLNGMFEGATYLKKLDVHTFNITDFSGIRSMFHKVGTQVKEGTEIIINDTFSNQRIFDYDFPNAFYTVNGSDPYSTTSLGSVIGRYGNKVVLIPVIPLDINKNGGDTSNIQFHGHRVGSEIDTKDIIVTKNGYRLVRWTDTQDGKNATINIPAGGKSTNTYADFYNTQNVLMAGQKLYAQWMKDYKVTSWDNQTYTKWSNTDIIIETNSDNIFWKIQLDWVDMPASGYDHPPLWVSGFLVLTLKSAYLDTLSAGDHTVKMMFSSPLNGNYEISATLTIKNQTTWWGGGSGWWKRNTTPVILSGSEESSEQLTWDVQEPQEEKSEFELAYEFAFKHGITTMDTIEKANMTWNLTRIAMAKMLSYYAINVLGQTPDTTKVCEFDDVSAQDDLGYNNWVTLACQLWFMWVWMKNFRPYDTVIRAEFVTALSRMLFGTPDWDPYYVTHLQKLKSEWIITNDNPNMEELRGYVMIMLMRSKE